MLYLCCSITKIFLSVLVVFGKYFDFSKIQKLCCLVLATQSRVEPVASPYKDFSRFTSDPLAGKCFNRKKDLEYFSNIWFFMLFVAQVGDLIAGGRSSCKGYIEIFAAQFITLS